MTTTLTGQRTRDQRPPTGPPTKAGPGRRGWITDWRPDDPAFWASTGRRTANRNLVFSILAEHVGFSVWALWSVIVVALPPAQFPFVADVEKKFWLVAIPNLVGALLRLPYTVAVPRFGGRNWTVVSALLLLIPVGLCTWCVTHPGTPYWFFLIAAASAGLGGGNFASSMTNISFFYPERRKGTALGLNAAGGNIGLSSVQFVVPMLIFFSLGVSVATAVWLPIVLVTAVCAVLFMDNLQVARSTLREQLQAARRPHAWIMSFLYIGTFGSFLGFSAAFPAVLQSVFPDDQRMRFLGTALLLPVAFTGPLVGSLARPLGGWLADRIGGAGVTVAVFAGMAAGAYAAILAADAHSLGGFLAAMLTLFAFAGVGNGSTYRMIPAIFAKQARAEIAAGRAAAASSGPRTADATAPTDAEVESILTRAKRESAATIGMAGSIGALGGFALPKVIGDSIKATGGIGSAFTVFIASYAVFAAVTWLCYLRRGSMTGV